MSYRGLYRPERFLCHDDRKLGMARVVGLKPENPKKRKEFIL